MMKRVLSAFALTAATSTSAFATTITVDFDDVVSGFYDSATSFNGLVFDRDIQVLPAANTAPGPGQSGQVARQSTPPFGAQPRGGSVGGSFEGFTVSGLSFIVGDSGGDTDLFQLSGFDVANNLVAQSPLIESAAATTVSITGAGIASFFLFIEDVPVAFNGSSVFDNVQFTKEVSEVPLPASVLLLVVSLAGLGGLARRKA